MFGLSQSLSSRAMSFDIEELDNEVNNYLSQSLSSRAMSFDLNTQTKRTPTIMSQSLSSRAISFDDLNVQGIAMEIAP